MVARFRASMTYANVMATIAVFVSLGGSAYAAAALSTNQVKARHIAANAVSTSEIKKDAVRGSELGPNAVDSSNVIDGSLGAGDFANGTLLRGPQGDRGPQGERGPEGPANPNADTLDGIDSAALLKGKGEALFARGEPGRGIANQPLMTLTGFGDVVVGCGAGGTADFEFRNGTTPTSFIWATIENTQTVVSALDPGDPATFSTGDSFAFQAFMGRGAGANATGIALDIALVASPAAGQPCSVQVHGVRQTG